MYINHAKAKYKDLLTKQKEKRITEVQLQKAEEKGWFKEK